MPEVTFTYTDTEYDLEITVQSANLKMGIQHAVLYDRQEQKHGARDASRELNIERYWLCDRYASINAGTTRVISKDDTKKSLTVPLSEETYLELPESLLDLWEAKVYEVNPHWSPFFYLTKKDSSGSTDI